MNLRKIARIAKLPYTIICTSYLESQVNVRSSNPYLAVQATTDGGPDCQAPLSITLIDLRAVKKAVFCQKNGIY